jgi:hypothetical protein
MKKINDDLFKKKQIKNIDYKIGGAAASTSMFSDGTSRFSDCMPTSYDDDDTGWISDSRSKNQDTERAADGCNSY